MANNTLLLGSLVTPLVGAIVALIFANSNRLQRSIGVLTGLLAWVFSVSLLVQVHDAGVQTYALGNWMPPYGIVLVADKLGALFAFMVTTIMIGGLVYTFARMKVLTYRPLFAFPADRSRLVGAMLTGDLLRSSSLWSDGAGVVC